MNAQFEHPLSSRGQYSTTYSTGAEGERKSSSALQGLTRWAFLLLVFAIPFETVDLGGGRSVTITKILGYLFLGSALLLPKKSLGSVPKALLYFGIYFLIMILTGLIQGTPNRDEFSSRIFQMAQNLMLFWIAYNLMREENIARSALLAFGLSASILAILQRSGLTRVVVETRIGDRLTALGENSNTLGANFALAILFLIGISYGFQKATNWQRILVLPLVALMLTGLTGTGSRGALLILIAGFVVLILQGKGVWQKARNLTLLVCFSSLIFYFVNTSEVYSRRWERTIQTGSLAHREDIFPQAWNMFLESPWTGWGPVTNVYELGNRTGATRRDTHNLFLWVLTEDGLLGAIPFFLGMGACLWRAWKSRRGVWGTVPLALFVALLVMNSSDTSHNRKTHWITLAFCLAVGSQVAPKLKRLAVPLELRDPKAI